MFSNYLSTIEGIEIFPVVSLILFFTVFCVIIYRTYKADKKFIKHMSCLPLDNFNETKINPERENENTQQN